MKTIYLLVLLLSMSACKNEVSEISKQNVAITNDLGFLAEKDMDSIAYFPMALTYKYTLNGEESELWFYVNEETQQILFVPNDDMLQGIISYPNGEYKIFGTTESGKKTIITQKLDAIVAEEILDAALVPLTETKTIDQANIQQKNIECSGYKIDYIKMEGGETLFATSEIPINSFQLYGFCRLAGDAKLPVEIDCISFFKKEQTLTHLERANFKLELLNYGPNPYEFVTKEF